MQISPGKHETDLEHTVHGHLIDLRRVVLLNVTQNANVVGLDKVDGHTLAAETSRATDAARRSLVNGEMTTTRR